MTLAKEGSSKHKAFPRSSTTSTAAASTTSVSTTVSATARTVANKHLNHAVDTLISAMTNDYARLRNSNTNSSTNNIHEQEEDSAVAADVWVDETLGRVREGVLAVLRRRAAADRLRPELREKIRTWLVSFYHLDPRYKILTFFNQVARDGADDLVNEEEDGILTDEMHPAEMNKRESLTRIEKLLKDAFTTSSVLTVWRPCSNDAMRKMMENTGVGKGLDIKGKSAKRGILSGFVPFVQIHLEEHKALVSKISRKAKMRVYYTSKVAREQVMDELEPLGNDYFEFDKDKVIPSEMTELDRYASKGYFGIELYQRLFWLGYVLNQGIERTDDKQHGTATGRPSVPGFQDANLKTLKLACDQTPKPDPMPVVFQYDGDHPMSPQHLLMAYEENGTVKPVVSDFDGFLLGWRREALWFGCNLPRDQEDLMLWCADRIEEILDSPSSDTWTERWLELLKKDNPDPDFPQYGFGDPKSYGIMERAAMQLADTGAVRHGSECFNYYFPQEIDDTLLIISDTLKPVPWKYVNPKQLQSILSQQIWDGFVFPINPKWILCDPGWKRLYDQLMASDALYAEYTKDVWYPPQCGIREKIDKIYAKHPRGFQRLKVPEQSPTARGDKTLRRGDKSLRGALQSGYNLSGNAAYDLAEIELDNFVAKQKRRESGINKKMSAEVLSQLQDLDDELSSDED